jgi:hypothetical protein
MQTEAINLSSHTGTTEEKNTEVFFLSRSQKKTDNLTFKNSGTYTHGEMKCFMTSFVGLRKVRWNKLN